MGQALGPALGIVAGVAAGVLTGGAGFALMPAIIAATSVGGTVMGMQAADQQSKAQQAQAQSERQAAQYNATVLRNNADAANQATTAQESQQRQRFDFAQGRNIASAAQSGAGMDGSNLDVLRQNAVQGELDALNIRYNGANQASGLLSQANMQDYQVAGAQMRGAQAKQAGQIGVASALIAGVGKGAIAGQSAGLWGNAPTTTGMNVRRGKGEGIV